MKILLVEDDASISSIARITLQRIGGHDVICVDNGLDAIARMQNEAFDLVMLDCMMPGIDGLETCKRLKSEEKTAGVPIIFMSAKNQQSDVEDGIKAGALGYIVKPFDAKELCNEIQKIYNKHLWSQSA